MLISIIIPCYNVAPYLAASIDSALNQTYQSIEIIAIDNNSSDHTLSILEKYQQKYPFIISIYHEKKQGAPAARNKGLSMAKGEWIQFLDADDILYPEKIQKQVKLIHPDSDLIISNYWYQISKSNTVQMKYSRDDLWQSFLQNRLGITSCYLWKKEKIEIVGGWKEGMNSSQEYELLFNFLKINSNIIFDENCCTLVRRRANSISTTAGQDLNWATLIDQRLRVKAYLKDQRPEYYNQNKIQIDRAIVEHLSKYGLYDLEKAVSIFQTSIKTLPSLTQPTNGRFHQWSYNLLGFRWGTIFYRKYLNLLRLLGKYDY